MSEKVSLQKIIEAVLTEKGRDHDDASIRQLRRSFDRLLENMGGDKERIKGGGRTLSFKEHEVPYIKIMLRQLYDEKGLIYKIARERAEKSKISLNEIHGLIQSILDEEIDNGASEDELVDLMNFLIELFGCAPLYISENCHRLIDMISYTIQGLPLNNQTASMFRLEHILKKEVSLLVEETAVEMIKLVELVNDNGIYYEPNPEIRAEYIRRDKRALAQINEDEGLRHYIEWKFGKKAEVIFKYAALDI